LNAHFRFRCSAMRTYVSHPAAAMTPPEGRPERLSLTRSLKMARSAHAYVRGSTIKFYEWLEDGRTKVPDGPSIWICGDCHVGNLGPLADAKGRVAVQIRDLDQTVIGNPAHDLIRLGLSLASAARGSDLPGVTTAQMMEALMDGYEEALEASFETDRNKSHQPQVIQALLKQSVRRRWRHLASERLDTVKPTIPLDKRFWPLRKSERHAIEAMFRTASVKTLLPGFKNLDAETIEVADAAYWVKGCSSLGRLRFAVLLRLRDAGEEKLCLVDVKEGVAAAALRSLDAGMPIDNAVRVVTGAKALSPNLGGRMVAARLLDKAVVLRELMPQDLKIELHRLKRGQAMSMAHYLASVVGHAHGRQMDAKTRKAWLRELAKRRTSRLDAPSWLWLSVVDLVGAHESAYLEHCRRHALAQAA
jgi:uncharacterized protein (DUF2252 family)